ncbi:mitotic spindle assembly checkpoint protein MAD1, partial [Silurus asotus]
DMEDDTIIFSTLKSFKSLISRPESSLLEPEASYGRSDLQKLYTQRVEMEEAAERIHSKTSLLQLTQEKQQMELSHKRARIELEKEAHNSSRDLQRQVDLNQDMLMKIRRLEEKDEKTLQSLNEHLENNKVLKRNVEELQKQVQEKDIKLSEASQMMSELKDEIRTLNQKLQIQESKFSTQNLEKQALEEQLEMQQKKYQEVNQKYQNLQMSQISNTESEIKMKELKRRLELQEQDSIIIKNMKSEVTKLPELKREIKHLQEENAYLREMQENSSLLKEETEGLRRKLERMEKVLEEKLKIELEKEKLVEELQVWENIGQTTGLNISRPEALHHGVAVLHYLSPVPSSFFLFVSMRALEKTRTQLQSETAECRSKALEEQKKRENQDALVRRLQKRVLLLTKERDGMRAILESYDSELAASEYSPQLTRRVKEAEEMLQKVQNHNAEMEIQLCRAQEEAGTFKLKAQQVAVELEALKEQKSSVSEANPIATEEEIQFLRTETLIMAHLQYHLQCHTSPVISHLQYHLSSLTCNITCSVTYHLSSLTCNITCSVTYHLSSLTCNIICSVTYHLSSLTCNITCSVTHHLSSLTCNITCSVTYHLSSLTCNITCSVTYHLSSLTCNITCSVTYHLSSLTCNITCSVTYHLSSLTCNITCSVTYHLSSLTCNITCSVTYHLGAVGSGNMQLLETDFSRTLTELVDLHLFHQKSIPVFLSAVTLDLFSRQTVV